MKSIRVISMLLAAILLFSLCCAGCAKDPAETTAKTEPTLTEAPTPALTEPAPETTEPGDPEGDALIRWQNGGKARYLPREPLTVPKLSEMEYARPDVETLIAKLEALTEKVPQCADAEALLKDYYDIVPYIRDYVTMCDLAFFRYCADTADDYYADEYAWCDEQNGLENEKEEALYAAFAASPCRDALEQAYFGEGFFRDYDGFNTADEAYFDLKQRESDLLFQYYELAGAANLSSAREIERNHDASGTILMELIKVRQQIAAAKGYENYMDYSYARDYHRDYTTAQARAYLDQVKALLAPLTGSDRFILGDYSDWRDSKAMEMLSAAAEQMGGPIRDSFRFLSDRELYDVSYGRDKMSIGFTTYLDNYEAPCIFIDPDAKDLLTALFHEFGHFTDWYYNYGVAGDYETGETYSQAMPYLAFTYADSFTDNARTRNLRAVLADLLVYSILQTGAYADFELQAYALAPEELTLDRLDGIFDQCVTDYGLAGLHDVHFMSGYWSVYQHFFAYPGYVISYSDSALASLQICRLEAEEPGAGVDAFCRLLDRTRGKKFAAVLAEAGLDSPFEAATLEKTAEFLREAFGMD